MPPTLTAALEPQRRSTRIRKGSEPPGEVPNSLAEETSQSLGPPVDNNEGVLPTLEPDQPKAKRGRPPGSKNKKQPRSGTGKTPGTGNSLSNPASNEDPSLPINDNTLPSGNQGSLLIAATASDQSAGQAKACTNQAIDTIVEEDGESLLTTSPRHTPGHDTSNVVSHKTQPGSQPPASVPLPLSPDGGSDDSDYDGVLGGVDRGKAKASTGRTATVTTAVITAAEVVFDIPLKVWTFGDADYWRKLQVSSLDDWEVMKEAILDKMELPRSRHTRAILGYRLGETPTGSYEELGGEDDHTSLLRELRENVKARKKTTGRLPRNKLPVWVKIQNESELSSHSSKKSGKKGASKKSSKRRRSSSSSDDGVYDGNKGAGDDDESSGTDFAKVSESDWKASLSSSNPQPTSKSKKVFRSQKEALQCIRQLHNCPSCAICIKDANGNCVKNKVSVADAGKWAVQAYKGFASVEKPGNLTDLPAGIPTPFTTMAILQKQSKANPSQAVTSAPGLQPIININVSDLMDSARAKTEQSVSGSSVPVDSPGQDAAAARQPPVITPQELDDDVGDTPYTAFPRIIEFLEQLDVELQADNQNFSQYGPILTNESGLGYVRICELAEAAPTRAAESADWMRKLIVSEGGVINVGTAQTLVTSIKREVKKVRNAERFNFGRWE